MIKVADKGVDNCTVLTKYSEIKGVFAYAHV